MKAKLSKPELLDKTSSMMAVPNPFPGIDPTRIYKTKHLPGITPYTESYYEAARAKNEGPRYIKRGRSVMYPGQWLIDWLLEGEVP